MPRKLNKEQQEAINSPINIDTVISAGAGSGKTFTLSKKVSEILKNKLIKPSEVLVLTFTNNSAHDMKMKIIDTCEEVDPNLAALVTSAHIQTFDSFLQELVQANSAKLNIADNINVINSEVLNAKVSVFLDDILKDYLINDFNRMVNTIKKLSLNSDDSLKKIVINLYNFLDNYLDEDRNKYIANIKDIYAKPEYFDKLLDEYSNYFKEKIILTIREAYFVNNYYNTINLKGHSIDDLNKLFSSNGIKDIVNYDLSSISFSHQVNEELFEDLNKLLSYTGKAFFEGFKTFYNNQKIKKDNGSNAKMDPDGKAVKKILQSVCNIDKTISNFGEFIANDDGIYYSLEKEYNKFASFKDDIDLIFDIEEELYKRIEEYQKSKNTYTFSSLVHKAIKLLDDEAIADKLRNQYKFIMIDEYQDTNDIQEIFINTLLKPSKEGNHPTLFVVGDAKQSIYGFRNSDVSLFNARKDKKDINLINMNTNYRSGKPLLKEINYIFKHFMSKNNGGIEFNDEKEQLKYDEEANIYNVEYNNFGIKRIVSKSGYLNDGFGDVKHREEIWEAYAIADDIKKKLNDPSFQISDLGKNNYLRRAKLSDFTILTRSKSCFDLYRDVFAREDLKLNLVFDTDLKEIDAINVIESLLSLIAYEKGIDEGIDFNHCFMSVARSYICEMDDTELIKIVSEDTNNNDSRHTKVKQSALYKKIENFAETHKNVRFDEVFADLLIDFNVLQYLYKIGNIEDNVDKIESLYNIILIQQQAREDMGDFLALLNTIKKYKLDFASNSEISVRDAVSLMTIHASKGLQKKIVYLPCSSNICEPTKRGDSSNKFSKKYGPILPFYNYEINDGDDEHPLKEVDCETFLEKIYNVLDPQKALDHDEAIRLFYVALTRAENTVYIVGDQYSSDEAEIRQTTPYGMLNYLPKYPVFNKTVMEFCRDENLESYILKCNEYKDALFKSYNLNLDYNTDTTDIYSHLVHTYYKNNITKHLADDLKTFRINIYNKLFLRLKSDTLTFDEKVRLFSLFAFKQEMSFQDIRNLIDEQILGPDDEYEVFIKKYEMESYLKEYIEERFVSDILNRKYASLCFEFSKDVQKKLAEEKKNNIDAPLTAQDHLYPLLLKFYLNCDYDYKMSYECDDFKDETTIFDIYSHTFKTVSKPNNIPKVLINNEIIKFSERRKKKASRYIEEDDKESISLILDHGTRLHKYMEIVDFCTKNTSFIEDSNDKSLIDSVLSLPLFNDVIKADKFYKEYPYLDVFNDTYGYIDLLYIKGTEIYIVDYKYKNIDEPYYVEQMETYRQNISRLFNVSENHIHLKLLSIMNKEIKEIN